MASLERIGIMQGRLVDPVGDRIQAFPYSRWEEELSICDELRLGCIEWVYDYEFAERNPLHLDRCVSAGSTEILSKYDVRVNSVIADYFMVDRLFGKSGLELRGSIQVLEKLIVNCAHAGIPLVEIPFVDSAHLETKEIRSEVVSNLMPIVSFAASKNIKISLETALPPDLFRRFLEEFEPLTVYANYDIGNSAAMGFDPREEIYTLGSRIINVHVKDRCLSGGTVPLGSGNADFDTVFSSLCDIGYSGDYVLQAAREDLIGAPDKPDPRETIASYLAFLEKFHLER